MLLRGPNGAGKTTLLRTLAGFIDQSGGNIALRKADDGAALEGDRAEAIHFIGHVSGIKPRLSVFENVSFWQRYYSGPADAEAAENALDAFGLLHLAGYPAAHLSQGQARRLALSRLLAATRPLWLLDEPSVSLDALATAMLERAIAGHLQDGGSAIIATHLDLNLPGASILRIGGGSAQTTG
jgi:heme exporter protein A